MKPIGFKSLFVEDRLPLRCRIFGHSWHTVEYLTDNYNADSRRGKHTHARIEECWRCKTQRRYEWFDDHSYWRSVERDLEDERLEEVIRRATR